MPDELLSRQAPYSIEAEQAVLGSMLIEPKCIPGVIERLKPDDFYVEADRLIYDARAVERMLSAQETQLPKDGAEQIARMVTETLR